MMSDRFKFRVWDKISNRYFFLELKFGDNGFHPGFIEKPEFEQCTGLKDKNGRLIYEGDIVEIFAKNKYAKGIYQIKFDKNDCEYDLFDKDDDFLYQLESDKSEYLTILGNIHENKELLDE